MRDFYLFTKKPIVLADCKEKILAEVQKKYGNTPGTEEIPFLSEQMFLDLGNCAAQQ